MSNSNKVTVDKLGASIMKYLEEYKEDIDEDVVDLSNKYSKEARKELIAISPKAKKIVKLRGGGVQKPRRLCWFLVY